MNLSPEVIIYLIIIAVSLIWRLFFSKKLKPLKNEELEDEFYSPDKTATYQETVVYPKPPPPRENTIPPPLAHKKPSVDKPLFNDLVDTNEQKNNPYVKYSSVDYQNQSQKNQPIKSSKPDQPTIKIIPQRSKKRINLNKSNLKKAILYKELLTPKYF